MAKTLDEIMAQLPESRQQAIEARGVELLNEYLTLRDYIEAMGAN